MNPTEQRRFPRHETRIPVTIHKGVEQVTATMVDVSEGGIGVASQTQFRPGSKVQVTATYFKDYSIIGTVKWAARVKEDDSTLYRIGIEADEIQVELGTDTLEAADRSEFVKRLLSVSSNSQ